jgi:hypothetical protein
MRKTFGTLPELFFMGIGMFWIAESYFTLGSVNYFAMLVAWLLFLQLFYKNRIAGLVYGIVFGSFSVYMLLTIITGYYESVTSFSITDSAIMGAGLFATGIVMAVAMVYKYVTAKAGYDESVLTVTY